MSVFRVNKSKNYTIMSNTHLKDKNLSLKAKGLLSLMLSLPDNWDYSISGLIKICKEGEIAVKSTLNELKKQNYLVISKERKSDGKFVYIYDIFENAIKNSSDLEAQRKNSKKPEGGFPPLVNPPLEKPKVENQVQLNTKNKITKNKEKVKKKKAFNDYEQREYTDEDFRKLENRIVK